MTPKTPLTAFVREERLEADAGPPRARVDPARYGTLAALAREWVPFTPALLYLRGRWPDARWADLGRDAGRPVRLAQVLWPSPLFAGLADAAGNANWEYGLFLARPGDWPAVRDFVVRAASVCPAPPWAGLAAAQALTLPDQTAAGVAHPTARVAVAAFGVRATDATWAFDSAAPGGRPRPARYRASRAAADYLLASRREVNPTEAAVWAALDRRIAAAAAGAGIATPGLARRTG